MPNVEESKQKTACLLCVLGKRKCTLTVEDYAGFPAGGRDYYGPDVLTVQPGECCCRESGYVLTKFFAG